jgi:hypothetical protein
MGSWNFEELGNWELDTLALGGFGEEMLAGLGQQQQFLMELLGKDGGDEAEQGDGIDPSLIVDDDRYKEQYGVIVMCESEAEQAGVYERLTSEGYKCKVVVT